MHGAITSVWWLASYSALECFREIRLAILATNHQSLDEVIRGDFLKRRPLHCLVVTLSPVLAIRGAP